MDAKNGVTGGVWILSERQTKVVAAAITMLSLAVIVAAVGTVLWLTGKFFVRFSHVFLPLAVASILALVSEPYYEFLRVRLRLPAPLAVAVLFLSGLLPVAAFLWFFGAIAVDQVTRFVASFPEWWARVTAAFEVRWPAVVAFFQEHPIGQRIRTAISGQQQAVLDGLQYVGATALVAWRGVLRWVALVLAWAVVPVYLVFFLKAEAKNFDGLERHLPFLKPETRADVVYLFREFVNIIVAFFRGQLIVAFFMGILFAAGFAAVGLELGFVLGLLLGLLNIIPYLGSIVGLAVCLPLAFFQTDGGWATVIGVIVIFTIVQCIEGYFLTPTIMGKRTGLHPVVIIVAVFFWGSALNGILGMILAIPLTAFLVVFWRLARDKYIGEWL